MRKLTLVILCSLVFSCEKEKIIEVKNSTPVPSWTPHPQFTEEAKIKYNSLSSGDFLFLSGPYYLCKLDRKGKALHYFAYRDYPFGKKLPIGSTFIVDPQSIGVNGLIFKKKNTQLTIMLLLS